MQEPTDELLIALGVTAEVCGTSLSKGAAMVMGRDLAEFPEGDVLRALGRCRRELTGRLSLAAILARLPKRPTDHPGVEEAWSLVPKTEDETAVVTHQILEAMGAAMPLWEKDRVAARMAFREVYERLVADSDSPVWIVTSGTDRLRAEAPLRQAVALGRLSSEKAERLIGAGSGPSLPQALAEAANKLLEKSQIPPPDGVSVHLEPKEQGDTQ